MQNHPETRAASGRSLKPGLALVLGSLAIEIIGSFVFQQVFGPANLISEWLRARAKLYFLPISSIALVMDISGLVLLHRAQARLAWTVLALTLGYVLALTYFFQTAGPLWVLLRSPVLPRN